ncbi:hypothetical protein RJ640_022648 [Escallonia rubra]|uniref:30S ribosomal protein S21, chloroplastic n=1 Tax=Escallonia rubra TaxID=112253 RepID=A0AA88R5U6_9ASTE|nr:hypothetical protein RJ640_022648 [Escallonia rubra]
MSVLLTVGLWLPAVAWFGGGGKCDDRVSYSVESPKPLTPVVPNKESHFPSSSPLPSDLLSVICPCLEFSNTLCFKSGYNVQLIVGEGETEEALLTRFRRKTANIVKECKRRKFFETNQEQRKRKARDAARRNRKSWGRGRAVGGWDERRTLWSPGFAAGRAESKAMWAVRRPKPKAAKQSKQEAPMKEDNDKDDNWELVDVELPYY